MRYEFVAFGLLAIATSQAAIAGGNEAGDTTGSIAPLSINMTIDTSPSPGQTMLTPADFLAGLRAEAIALGEIAKDSAAAAATALASNDPNYISLQTRAGADELAASQAEAVSEAIPTQGR